MFGTQLSKNEQHTIISQKVSYVPGFVQRIENIHQPVVSQIHCKEPNIQNIW